MLRVIKKLQVNQDIPIKSTFLGAHAIPKEFKIEAQKYMDLVIHKILPKVAEQHLTQYIDNFVKKDISL